MRRREVHYHPDIVLMIFRHEKPSAKITLESVEKFDDDLHTANNENVVAACVTAGIPDPSKFDRSRVLGMAVLALGSAGRVGAAAKAYKTALDEGVIG
jgi:hypothetical protein